MSESAAPIASRPGRLYLWVLIGVIVGCLVGWLDPPLGKALKPLADGFVALIKMLIGPVIFCTVALGIAGMADLRKLGRVGLKALIYFELVSTLALAIGLTVANLLRPGEGFAGDTHPQGASVDEYQARAKELGVAAYLLHIIPRTFLDAFTGNGDILQVLLIAVLSGCALAGLGEQGRPVTAFLESANRVLFAIVGMIMRLAPIGAGAAMAATIGSYGAGSLLPLMKLMGCFYLTCLLFILGALGTIAALAGFSILRFVARIRDEILIVLGTSSSEAALVPLMSKLERLGCSRSVVGVVVPAGYSFNLDGTNIYLTLAALFVAQALGIELSLAQQATILGVAMLTSKGAAGVTGSGFVTLAATLAVVPGIPVEGLVIILGIDRFMSEARAVTNLVGNGVAAVVISKWERELDREALRAQLAPAPAAAG